MRYISITYENKNGVLRFDRDHLHILAISGLGTPQKVYTSHEYVGYDGAFTDGEKKSSRAITLKFDFPENQYEIRKIMRVLDIGGTLKLQCGKIRRKITVNQVSVSEPEDKYAIRVFTIQFKCDSPFFNDYNDTEKACFDVAGGIVEWTLGTEGNPIVWGRLIHDCIITNGGDYPIEPTFIINVMGNSSDNSTLSILKVNDSYTSDDADEANVLQKISFTHTFKSGEEITVNLNGRDDNGRYIRSSIDGNISHKRDSGISLSKFKLDTGDNRIVVKHDIEDASVSVRIIYNNNYAEAVY